MTMYVYLRGGLGNQLFQICYGIGLSARHGFDVQLVDHYFQGGEYGDKALGDTPRHSYFDTFFKTLSGLRWKQTPTGADILRLPQITELKPFHIDRVSSDKPDFVVNGYFHKWALIKEFVPDFVKSLQLKPHPNSFVGLHFRYDDYVSKYPHVYVPQPTDFYVQSLTYLTERLPRTTTVLVCCQPSDWEPHVKPIVQLLQSKFPHLTFPRPPTLLDDWQELLLLSQCAGIGTTNSSFSYWAAIIGEQTRQDCGGVKPVVTRPHQWFQESWQFGDSADNMCPPHWHKIKPEAQTTAANDHEL